MVMSKIPPSMLSDSNTSWPTRVIFKELTLFPTDCNTSSLIDDEFDVQTISQSVPTNTTLEGTVHGLSRTQAPVMQSPFQTFAPPVPKLRYTPADSPSLAIDGIAKTIANVISGKRAPRMLVGGRKCSFFIRTSLLLFFSSYFAFPFPSRRLFLY